MKRSLFVAYLVMCAAGLASVVAIVDRMNDKLAQINAPTTEAVPVAVPDPAAVAAARAQSLERAEAAKLAREQAARIKAELDKLAYPKPMPPPAAPKARPAYSFAAPGPELMPLEGWVDQPNKDRPGRIHTNLMIRHVTPSVRPRVAPRAPCLVMVAKPAERIERSYGWLEVPARTIPVPCGR